MYKYKPNKFNEVYLNNGYFKWNGSKGVGESDKVSIYKRSKLEMKIAEHAVWHKSTLDSNLIKLLRNGLGMSQFVCANKLNIGPTTLRHYENGAINISGSTTILLKLFYLSLKDKNINKWIGFAEKNKPFEYNSRTIKEVRGFTGLTQVQFARIIGASLSSLKGWENSRSKIHKSSCYILHLIEHFYFDGLNGYLDDLSNIDDMQRVIFELENGKWREGDRFF